MKQNKFISGFFLLDEVEITEEYQELLDKLKKDYLIQWQLLKTINQKELYLGVLRDASKLNDVTNEEGVTTPGLITIMGGRNIDILGIWNKDGSLLGQTKNIIPAEYSEEGELIKEDIITFEGNPTYPFNKVKYVPFMEDINTYDDEGNILTSKRPTEPISIRMFAGFKDLRME